MANGLIVRKVKGSGEYQAIVLDESAHPNEAGRILARYYSYEHKQDKLFGHALQNQMNLKELGELVSVCEWRPAAPEDKRWNDGLPALNAAAHFRHVYDWDDGCWWVTDPERGEIDEFFSLDLSDWGW